MFLDDIQANKYAFLHLGEPPTQLDQQLQLSMQLESLINNATPFDFTNIEPLYLSTLTTTTGFRFSTDAFAAIPPFPVTWCEVRSEDGLDLGAVFIAQQINGPIRIYESALSDHHQSRPSDQPVGDTGFFLQDIPLAAPEISIDTGFLINIVVLVHPRLPHTNYVLTAIPSGAYIVDTQGKPVTRIVVADNGLTATTDPTIEAFLFGLRRTCLFQYGFNLLACKNVHTVEIEPSAKMQRARYRRGKRPLNSYYEIKITAPGTRMEHSSEAHATIMRRFHAVRGHFANYSEDKPLFGRLAGRFWIPSHTRGATELGHISKRYRVES